MLDRGAEYAVVFITFRKSFLVQSWFCAQRSPFDNRCAAEYAVVLNTFLQSVWCRVRCCAHHLSTIVVVQTTLLCSTPFYNRCGYRQSTLLCSSPFYNRWCRVRCCAHHRSWRLFHSCACGVSCVTLSFCIFFFNIYSYLETCFPLHAFTFRVSSRNSPPSLSQLSCYSLSIFPLRFL